MHRTSSTSPRNYRRRFDWGPTGCEVLAEAQSYLVVVDVLRFTTAVEAAVSRGAVVYPYQWRDESAQRFADELGVPLAASSGSSGPSLSPVALLDEPTLSAVVLPSPNGSTCSLIAANKGAVVIAGCLRNAGAIANYLATTSLPVSVIACGERWPDGTLRPALEDLLGAGAILSLLGGELSPEASSAVAEWSDAFNNVAEILAQCLSGQELIERGHGADVEYASGFGVSDVVPVLVNGAFRTATQFPCP